MSSYPFSICATHGSSAEVTPTSSSPAHSSNNHDDLATQTQLSTERQNNFAEHAASSHPSYQHYTAAASVQAHTTAMRAYLDSFDAVMAGGTTTTQQAGLP
ncbi:hypothetical protein B0J14DRAFT_639212 [Halenospora varia]|nr:hypothetical protein B0J14DRAFT_639212 [Halenospora varia]